MLDEQQCNFVAAGLLNDKWFAYALRSPMQLQIVESEGTRLAQLVYVLSLCLQAKLDSG